MACAQMIAMDKEFAKGHIFHANATKDTLVQIVHSVRDLSTEKDGNFLTSI